MRKKIIFYLVLYLVVFLVISVLLSIIHYKRQLNAGKNTELSRFKSDFKQVSTSEKLYNNIFSRDKKFLAYGAYRELYPGEYKLTFQVQSTDRKGGIYYFQISTSHGKKIAINQKIVINDFPQTLEFNLSLSSITTIEPRILYHSGSSDLVLKIFAATKTDDTYPWKSIFFYACIFSLFSYALLLTIIFAWKGNPAWKVALGVFILLIAFSLILRNAWLAEDAFITMRHVDNFLSGFGPVYNISERVEGFTHPLWFGVVSIFSWLGFTPKGAMVLPGLLFSLLFLYLLFFKIIRRTGEDSNYPSLNFSAVILIGISAFIDFGTSGLETSLSYLLLGFFCLMVFKGDWEKKPLQMGLVLALLILNRPDFGVFFIFIFLILLYKIVKKTFSIKSMGLFLTFPLILVGGYQVFRMGYYAALLPNPFYTKSGAGSYFSQGILYFTDFCRGSLGVVIIIIAGAALLMAWKKNAKKEFESRLIIVVSGLIHGFFVVRGGDFMHGRFFLPAFILFTMAGIGLFDKFFSATRIKRLTSIVVVLLLLFGSLAISPLQKNEKERYHNNISDERFWLYGNHLVPLEYLLKDDRIFMWKTIGLNYHNLYLKTKKQLTIAYHNIGFIGYYAGHMVKIIDRLGLIDPVVARKKISIRRRPGHEKSAPFGYLMMRKLTFGITPFSLWNTIAATKYGILRDLSPRTLRRFAFFLPGDFKKKLDRIIYDFLQGLTLSEMKIQADFLFFLKSVWYPHARGEYREFFDKIYDPETVKSFSAGYRWIEANKAKIKKLFSAISSKLTVKQFFANIVFAFREFNLKF